MTPTNHDFYSDDPIQVTDSPVKKRFSSILALLLLIVGGTYLVQTTLAANIAINTGAPVEFGQGVTATAACSGGTDLTITPNSTFTNVSGGGAHYLSSVTVSNIPSDCNGKDFTINAYGTSDSTPLALFNTTSANAVIYSNAGTFQLGVGSTGMTISSGSGTFTVSFTSPVATSGSVFKLTLQSGAHTQSNCELGISCNVGEVGPAGGWIVYKNLGGFSCGPTKSATCYYLESAKSDWNSGSNDFPWASSPHDGFFVGGSTANRSASSCDSIGCGYMNSKAAVEQGNDLTSAVGFSRAYAGGGKSDWYLPSLGEFFEMARTLYGVDLVQSIYWTSSEKPTSPVRGMWSTAAAGASGFSNYNVKSASHTVRPIRAF
jgi:hypothetical protein